MKKSIAIICEYKLFPQRIGGMDYFFVAYDAALKEQGYEITWFFSDVISFYFYDKLTIINANEGGVESCFLEYVSTNNLNFDIIITHFLQPVSPFYKKVKDVMDTQIIAVDHNPRPLKGFPFKKRIKNKIKGLLYAKYVDKLVGVSNYTRDYIIKDFGPIVSKKTITIHNGIKVENYKKQAVNREDKPFKFLVVSHLRESKGIQDLLKAVGFIDKNTYSNFQIDIYGSGPYEQELLELQRLYSLESVVSFKGSSPNLNELYHQYHYMIQPTYMECFSLSILESLASNVPVITTTVGGNLEVVENNFNGYIFDPKDVSALTKIIANIISNKITIDTNVATKIEKDFTLDIMLANHLKLIECI